MRAHKLRDEHVAFRRSLKHNSFDPLGVPKTIFEILYKDVTKKAKGIALSATFGPKYESVMRQLLLYGEEKTKERGNDNRTTKIELEQTRRLMDSILGAEDPDDLD